MDNLKAQLDFGVKTTKHFLRWMCFALVTGLVVGLVGTLFVKGLTMANNFRLGNPQIIYGLPLAGLFLVFIYRKAGLKEDKGTNQIISTLHAQSHVPFRMMPLIFIATITTHLFGGSAGREGAAVGMVSVFCGVTNAPIASLLIGFELFGFEAMKFLLIGVAISYLFSGYESLYSEQRITYSKLETKYVNAKPH